MTKPLDGREKHTLKTLLRRLLATTANPTIKRVANSLLHLLEK